MVHQLSMQALHLYTAVELKEVIYSYILLNQSHWLHLRWIDSMHDSKDQILLWLMEVAWSFMHRRAHCVYKLQTDFKSRRIQSWYNTMSYTDCQRSWTELYIPMNHIAIYRLPYKCNRFLCGSIIEITTFKLPCMYIYIGTEKGPCLSTVCMDNFWLVSSRMVDSKDINRWTWLHR